MPKDVQKLINYLVHLKTVYSQKESSKLNEDNVCNNIHQMKQWGLKHLHMNLDNYLYRNGIFNYSTALTDAKNSKNHSEIAMITKTKYNWYSNYGIPDQSHDLIKGSIDHWKIIAMLNSIIADLTIGSYNEGSTKDLQKGDSID